MNRCLNAAVVAAMLLLGAAGCGGDSTSSSTTTVEHTTSTATATTDYLGVTLSAATAGEPGVVVQSVQPDNASQLEVGDVIIAVDGKPVATPDELISAAGGRDAVGQFTLRVVRGSRRFNLTEVQAPAAYLGAEVKDATGGAKGAVIVSIASGSPAAKAGLQPDDLITALEGTPVASADGLLQAISTHGPGDTVMIRVARGSRELDVTATLTSRPTP